MSVRFLKVKIKSLAAESRIIRQEEYRSKGELRGELHNHRVTVVRNESRATHLAYDFLRGKLPSCNVKPEFNDWKRIQTMVNRYGPKFVDIKEIQDWYTYKRAISNQVNAPAFNPAQTG